jgi:hypothetical protein
MGSLQSLLKSFQVFDEGIISAYTHQILKGLEYLHNKNTIHRCKSPHHFSQSWELLLLFITLKASASRIWEKRDLFSMMLMIQHDNDFQ